MKKFAVLFVFVGLFSVLYLLNRQSKGTAQDLSPTDNYSVEDQKYSDKLEVVPYTIKELDGEFFVVYEIFLKEGVLPTEMQISTDLGLSFPWKPYSNFFEIARSAADDFSYVKLRYPGGSESDVVQAITINPKGPPSY